MIKLGIFLSILLGASPVVVFGLSRASNQDLAHVSGMYTSKRYCLKEGSLATCQYADPPVAGGIEVPKTGVNCDIPMGAPCYVWLSGPNKHDVCDISNNAFKKCGTSSGTCRTFNSGTISDCIGDDRGLRKWCDIPQGQKPLSDGSREYCDINGSDTSP
jgi:hypothetical protein